MLYTLNCTVCLYKTLTVYVAIRQSGSFWAKLIGVSNDPCICGNGNGVPTNLRYSNMVQTLSAGRAIVLSSSLFPVYI